MRISHTTVLMILIAISSFSISNDADSQVCPPGMVSYWKFDDGSGTIATDSYGNNPGTVHGAIWVSGQVGGALYFGGDGYVETDVTASSVGIGGSNPRTVNLWTKPSEAQPNFLFSIGSNSGTGRFFGVKLRNDNYSFDLDCKAIGIQGGLYEPSKWYMVTALYDGSDIRLYVNGTEEAIGTYTLDTLDEYEFIVGCRFDDMLYYHGVIDEVAIYNRALTPDEIRQHYENGLEGLGYCYLNVEIDIKPGSYPNSVNLGSKGVVPVAILSSPDFDATQVDPGTVELCGAGVAVRGKGNKSLAHNKDVNGDTLLDLVVKVETENFDPGQFQDGSACLSGHYGTQEIRGCDAIVIVPPETAPSPNSKPRLTTTWASIKSKY